MQRRRWGHGFWHATICLSFYIMDHLEPSYEPLDRCRGKRVVSYGAATCCWRGPHTSSTAVDVGLHALTVRIPLFRLTSHSVFWLNAYGIQSAAVLLISGLVLHSRCIQCACASRSYGLRSAFGLRSFCIHLEFMLGLLGSFYAFSLTAFLY